MDSRLPPILLNHIRFFQFCGYFDISLDANAVRRTRNEQFLMMWSALLMLFFIALMTHSCISDDEYFFSYDTFGYFNDMLKVCFAQLAMIVIYLESILKRGSLRRFWELYINLQGGEANLDSAKSPAAKRKWFVWQEWRQNCRFLCIFYGIIGIETLSVLGFIFFEPNKPRHVELFWFMFIPYIYGVHLRNLQIIFHIEMLRQELVKLELDLRLIVDYTKFGQRVSTFERFEEFLCRKLWQQQKIYQNIYEMFEHFQEAFAHSMVAVLLMVYVRILVDAYFVYYLIYTKMDEIGESETVLLFTAILEIPALLITSQNCMNVTKHIAYQLHSIVRQLDSLKISVQIQNFSLQMLHQRIRINGVGLTTIDGYMLTKAVGSITTYMIFFMQFMPKIRKI